MEKAIVVSRWVSMDENSFASAFMGIVKNKMKGGDSN
jgi:hypothetical protein